ncbi:MAG: hypothetical protein PHH98_05445 [Candidatus Gracilibacteria bacterium]|nr:hypothetical protein [Candidatus Gracilibacteria bacterium]
MCIKQYNINDERFSGLTPAPLPLITGEAIGNIVTITKDGAYNCICHVSGNLIVVDNDGDVSCDVGNKSKYFCGNVGLENKHCPYHENMK